MRSSSHHLGGSRGKAVAVERNASPSSWISDSTARERFMGWKNVKDIAPLKSIELSLFRNEGFIFPEKLTHQGLSTFVQMKGDCYSNLVNVFYNNLKVVNGDICSHVKRVDIMINNDTWLQVVGLKVEECLSHLPDSLHNRLTTKRKMFKDCMSKILSLSQIDFTGEIKITCNRTNEIGKATLTIIGLKKTILGWIFSDIDKTFKRVVKLKKSLMRMNGKIDEIIKNYVESSTSLEKSTDENDESSEEDPMEISVSE
ncbi:hypothetical protein LR48_Vigan04g128400 [Vigna angularis]|uniref:Uncharacterized protein n=1 Tax=Phaseolus angularis TaxID=3914 RepID=A0A0L9UEF5_PHAAN|nr:hypothetical protein LR48_Vigan04g128400 [Vigna angularis]